MKEITKIDMDKYHVVKTTDIEKYLSDNQKTQLSFINISIRFGRIKDCKKEWNKYLVLNYDDDIDIRYLCDEIQRLLNRPAPAKTKVNDIAVDLVNAIMKAKDCTSLAGVNNMRNKSGFEICPICWEELPEDKEGNLGQCSRCTNPFNMGRKNR